MRIHQILDPVLTKSPDGQGEECAADHGRLHRNLMHWRGFFRLLEVEEAS